MNNTPNSGGRKKKVTQGKGKIGKGEQVNTQGPVGRQDGYQGRQEGNPQKPQQNPNNGSEGDKGLGTDILGAMLGGGSSSQSSGGSVIGSLLGGSSGSSSSSSSSGGSVIGSLLGGSSGSSSSSSSSSQNSGGSMLGSLFGGSSGGSSSGSTKKGGGLGKILLIIAVIVIGYFILKSCMGGGCSMGNIAGNAADFSNGGTTSDGFMSSILSGYNTYDAADATAPEANTASTSTTVINTSVSNQARDKYTKLKGNGQDKTTLMVYMCGTDLESKYGMATNDLNEMLKATLNDNSLNIIVETGGTKTWKNSVMTAGTNQRWRIRKGGIEALDKNMGKLNMTSASTLTSFIKFCAQNYPADRYMLIFWDHGGGSLSGYGYDQYYSGSMTLDQINKALNDGGVKFDFIGFDACLMGTLETSVVIEKYADYLIASEETEPGCGWYYTNWLTQLCQNPSVNTVELAKTIIDDFNDVCAKNNAGDTTTLSIVDLAEFAGTVPDAFSAFSREVSQMLNSSEYQTVANARSGAREFGQSAGIDHIDLIHFASKLNTAQAKNLISVLQSVIKYNRTSRSMTNSYGMSIYFPYRSFKSVNSAVSLYNAIGVSSDYSAAIKSFASMAAGGQIATGSTSSPMDSLFGSLGGSSGSSSDILGALLGGGGSSSGAGDLLSAILGGRSLGDPENEWFESDRVLQSLDYYDAHAIYADDMHIMEKDGGWVLNFPDEKWELVETIQLNAFLDDGEGYIDLGMDNVFDFDNDGMLKIDFDGTWMALDGQVVPYYFMYENHDGDSYSITGRVPALLNGERVEVIIVFDNETEENEYGYVAGARLVYENGETDTIARGLIKLKDGDKLEFLCDYYSYDQQYQASYKFGDPIVVSGEIEVSNVSLEGNKCLVTYCLTDMYANEFWTEAKEF